MTQQIKGVTHVFYFAHNLRVNNTVIETILQYQDDFFVFSICLGSPLHYVRR